LGSVSSQRTPFIYYFAFGMFSRQEIEMKPQDVGRRSFLRKSAVVAGAAVAPVQFALGDSLTPVRPEWQIFKNTSHYSALLSAISTMKANTNPDDPQSWDYWTNVHVNRCPHNIAYFLGWHRGYLYHFEQQLRAVSGVPDLILPYWDYYTDPNIPAEFTDPGSGNPLYTSRANTNVSKALTMAPFSSTLINFQRGMSKAFEPSIESAPHNPVHDIIGGLMTTMQSPLDPIFWLHHANVDRLWSAWVRAGGGRNMPAKSGAYWNGSYTYTNTLTMPRRWTYDTTTSLGYSYQDETMPAGLPTAAAAKAMVRLQGNDNTELQTPPAVGSFRLSYPRATGKNTFSAGGSLEVGLDERSVSAQLPVHGEHGRSIAQIARGNAWPIPGSPLRFKSVHLVLDNLQSTSKGKTGGYYFQVYLNFPSAGPASLRATSILIGTLGAFQIAGATHHPGGPAQLRYGITHVLTGLSVLQIGMLTVSFVRIDGDNSPRGSVIGIGEARIELSTEDVQS
jgi:tyrosinase